MDRIELLKSMVEQDPTNTSAWYMLGEEHLQSGQLSEGLFAFSKALEQKDSSMEEHIKEYLKKVLVPGNEVDELVQAEENIESSVHHQEFQDQVNSSNGEQKAKLSVVEGKKQDNVAYFEEHKPKATTFEDVGGLDSLKKTIDMKIIKPFVNPGLFTKFRKKTGGGILLYGPPGCGKTFIAKATAGEIGANFHPVHISDILRPYLGESEQSLHAVFETARANRPSVLFFDEIDTLGYNRAKSNSDVMRPLVDSMLTEMESVHTNTEEMLIIGATNMPWDVDAAFKRPGRFDKLVFVPPPDHAAREIIFQLKLKDKPVASSVSLQMLAFKTEYYSGADIENVIEIATENVLNDIMDTEQERVIEMDDLLQAIEMTTPSTLDWLQTVKNYIKYSNQSGLYSDAAKYIKGVL